MRTTRLWTCFGAVILGAVVSAPALGQGTSRASVSSLGAQGNAASGTPSLSSDGRVVAFVSAATALVPSDTNGAPDVFVHVSPAGTTERVSVATGGAEANAGSDGPSISSDGRFVAFFSSATNLVPGDTNGWPDVFVRDRQTGTTERVNLSTGGVQGDGDVLLVSISGDGRFVAFQTNATNLVAGDTNGAFDVFVRDRQSGTTELVSMSTGGVQGNSTSGGPSISEDGRFVLFSSFANNLVSADTNGFADLFLRDRQSGTTERVSVATGGAEGNSYSFDPTANSHDYRFISSDGRLVAFSSNASNLVAGDTNGAFDVFVRDRQGGTTERVSVSSGGAQGNSTSVHASISSDGRFVAFEGTASNLVAGDTNGARDVFLRDRQSGTTELLSASTGGAHGNLDSDNPSISSDGRFVALQSAASNLVAGDTNGVEDVFVHDRGCPLSSASFRNAGSNPASFSCNAPVLGTHWSGTVDLTTTGHSAAYLYAFAARATTTLTQGQVLLGSGQLARFGPVSGPLASFSFAVPNDTALCGLHLTTQALHLGTVQPFATSNAMDLVVGQ